MAAEAIYHTFQAPELTDIGITSSKFTDGSYFAAPNFHDDHIELVIVDTQEEDRVTIYGYPIELDCGEFTANVPELIEDAEVLGEISPYTPPFRKELRKPDGTRAEMIMRYVGNSAVHDQFTVLFENFDDEVKGSPN